ncbi:amine oxidase [Elysia marginata]|uniref:Amine oxidase n=1 Tax=Elysia marginata TaxID=1093978 RepID=A0AAV4GY27_9GAST|nr:amine oxidase [Elysia marginata]
MGQDLVFWLTLGNHQIAHTEDLPMMSTTGNHMAAWFLPHNFFKHSPSMASRDAIHVSYKNQEDPADGVKLERNGNSRDQCVIPRSSLEEDIEENPDLVLQSRKRQFIYP